jgi:hypothetical protein
MGEDAHCPTGLIPDTADDKAAIGARCERFIAEVLEPRFLPEVRPSQFNYPVDIVGKYVPAACRSKAN